MSERTPKTPQISTDPYSKLKEINVNLANFTYVPPESTETPTEAPEQAETGLVGEVIVDETQIAGGGLEGVVTSRRLRRAQKGLEKLKRSARAHQNPAEALGELVPLPEHRFKYGSPSTATQYRSVEEYGDKGFAEFNPDATPMMKTVDRDESASSASLLQDRQDMRTGNRQAKANEIRSGQQYRLKAVWGPEIAQEDFLQTIKQREPGVSMRQAAKAYARFHRLEEKASNLEKKVQKSADGHDIPGKVIAKRLRRKQAKVRKLS